MNKRRIVVTAGLPYANGPIHLGHMVEYLIPDFWTRFQKSRGHECLYICADDTHGTPVMLRARERGIEPTELIAKFFEEHQRDFKAFEIEMDHFGSTNSTANRKLADDFFKKLTAGGHLTKKIITQSYCEHDKMFLPDRYVKGTCPKCHAEGQYGDSCDVCSATYEPTDIINPQCVLCQNTPTVKESEHFYFMLKPFTDFLSDWVPQHTSPEVSNKINEWLTDLQDWCISRDAPYFGFEIPDNPGKYYYVWLDAPIGYLSSTIEWCEKNGKNIRDYWGDGAEIYNSLGKDIINFHALFWPAMLKSAGWATPTQLFVHGMLTVDGVKMSKSKGTFINAETYLKYLDPIYLRYYFACKLNSSFSDLDLNINDFVTRVNADLIGKITNVASRGASMLHKLDGVMSTVDPAGAHLITNAQNLGETIASHFEARDFSKAILAIRSIADEANKYFDDLQPWKLLKSDPDKTKQILTTILNQFRIMAIYLKPFLPSYAAKVEALFNETPYVWADANKVLTNHAINKYEHIVTRLDRLQVDKIIAESKELNTNTAPKPNAEKAAQAATKVEAAPATIKYDDFAKVDLRVARITAAEPVEKADKLLRLTLDLGTETRQVFAGIKSAYQPDQLLGRLTVMVANLAPRKMRFGVSEGMVLCAGEGGKDLYLLNPDSGAKPGDKIS